MKYEPWNMLELYITVAKKVIAHVKNNNRKIYKIDLQGASNPLSPFLYLRAVAF